VVQQGHAPSALTGHRRAHEAGGSSTQNEHIELARSWGHGLCSG
jgi:hypothetical protein